MFHMKPANAISLRPDPGAMLQSTRRSWLNVITAHALAAGSREDPAKLLKRNWPDDARAALIMRGAVSPTTSEIYPAYDPVGPFRSTAPGAALPKLLDRGALKLNMQGVHTIRIPHVAGLPPVPVFVGEGQAAPNLQWTFASTTLGPVKKVLVLSAVTGEVEDGNADSAAAIIGKVLADASNKSIDMIAFDTNPGDDIRPAGLLHGVTPVAAAAAGVDACLEDRAALVGAISAAGVDPNGVIFVASPAQAQLMRDKTGDTSVLMSLGLPPKTVAAFAPSAIASGYSGTPEIETSKDAAVHYEDTNPQDVGGSTAPVRSAYQTNIISIRVRAMLAYAVAPGGAAVVQNVNW